LGEGQAMGMREKLGMGDRRERHGTLAFLESAICMAGIFGRRRYVRLAYWEKAICKAVLFVGTSFVFLLGYFKHRKNKTRKDKPKKQNPRKSKTQAGGAWGISVHWPDFLMQDLGMKPTRIKDKHSCRTYIV
jgi:hypothetical protein